MTNKEAIECIKSNYPDSRYSMLREACDLAMKTLENADKLWGDDFEGWCECYYQNMLALNDFQTKEEKYKWHDLRKNPDDLPKEDGAHYLTKVDDTNENDFGYIENYFYQGKFTSNGKVIAWKEFELFEEKRQ